MGAGPDRVVAGVDRGVCTALDVVRGAGAAGEAGDAGEAGRLDGAGAGAGAGEGAGEGEAPDGGVWAGRCATSRVGVAGGLVAGLTGTESAGEVWTGRGAGPVRGAGAGLEPMAGACAGPAEGAGDGAEAGGGTGCPDGAGVDAVVLQSAPGARRDRRTTGRCRAAAAGFAVGASVPVGDSGTEAFRGRPGPEGMGAAVAGAATDRATVGTAAFTGVAVGGVLVRAALPGIDGAGAGAGALGSPLRARWTATASCAAVPTVRVAAAGARRRGGCTRRAEVSGERCAGVGRTGPRGATTAAGGFVRETSAADAGVDVAESGRAPPVGGTALRARSALSEGDEPVERAPWGRGVSTGDPPVGEAPRGPDVSRPPAAVVGPAAWACRAGAASEAPPRTGRGIGVLRPAVAGATAAR